MNKITAILVASFTATYTAQAATPISFTEDFSSNTIGPNFERTSTAGTNPEFTTGAAVFDVANAGDPGRSFVGTTATDFGTVSFMASIDITVAPGGGASAFFGLGEGLVGFANNGVANGPSFGEPTGGLSLHAAFNADNRDNGEVNIGDFDSTTTGGITGTAGTTPLVGSGTHTIFLDFDSATQELVLTADIGQTGTITTLGTVDGSDNGIDATNSRIFFGGDDSSTFDNFSVTVIPEPTSTMLLGLAGILGLARRRR